MRSYFVTDWTYFLTDRTYFKTDWTYFLTDRNYFPTDRTYFLTECRYFPTDRTYFLTDRNYFPTDRTYFLTACGYFLNDWTLFYDRLNLFSDEMSFFCDTEVIFTPTGHFLADWTYFLTDRISFMTGWRRVTTPSLLRLYVIERKMIQEWWFRRGGNLLCLIWRQWSCIHVEEIRKAMSVWSGLFLSRARFEEGTSSVHRHNQLASLVRTASFHAQSRTGSVGDLGAVVMSQATLS